MKFLKGVYLFLKYVVSRSVICLLGIPCLPFLGLMLFWEESEICKDFRKWRDSGAKFWKV